MPSLNDPENFAGRVNYAAAVISAGRPTSRGFDNCFENSDGAAVSAALARRAERNPRIAANLPRYLCPVALADAVKRGAGRNLADFARELRAESRAAFAEMLARQAERNAALAAERAAAAA